MDNNEKYSEELNVAVRVVHMACALCQKVQKSLLSATFDDDVKSKDDDSLVTVAGAFLFFLHFSRIGFLQNAFVLIFFFFLVIMGV